MNETVSLNIEAIHQSAREKWFAAKTKRKSWREIDLRQFIEISVPNMIILVALALFLLSAPHTSKMFDMITPHFGFAGVLLCEFGLLYIAFRRKVERKSNGSLPHVIRGLEVLLFITSILVNGAGALIAVTSSTGIDSLSADTIIKGAGSMPIVVQVGLLLVPLAALIIPIGTVVAGEGLAAHVLEGKHLSAELVAEWANVEQLEVYRTAYSYLLSKDVNSRDAMRRAGSATTNLFNRSSGLTPSVYVEGEAPIQSTFVTPPAARYKPATGADRAERYLLDHPECNNLATREIAERAGCYPIDVTRARKRLNDK